MMSKLPYVRLLMEVLPSADDYLSAHASETRPLEHDKCKQSPYTGTEYLTVNSYNIGTCLEGVCGP